jgi:ATP-dependent Zn protease
LLGEDGLGGEEGERFAQQLVPSWMQGAITTLCDVSLLLSAASMPCPSIEMCGHLTKKKTHTDARRRRYTQRERGTNKQTKSKRQNKTSAPLFFFFSFFLFCFFCVFCFFYFEKNGKYSSERRSAIPSLLTDS